MIFKRRILLFLVFFQKATQKKTWHHFKCWYGADRHRPAICAQNSSFFLDLQPRQTVFQLPGFSDEQGPHSLLCVYNCGNWSSCRPYRPCRISANSPDNDQARPSSTSPKQQHVREASDLVGLLRLISALRSETSRVSEASERKAFRFMGGCPKYGPFFGSLL